jgi:hypothetical protein
MDLVEESGAVAIKFCNVRQGFVHRLEMLVPACEVVGLGAAEEIVSSAGKHFAEMAGTGECPAGEDRIRRRRDIFFIEPPDGFIECFRLDGGVRVGLAWAKDSGEFFFDGDFGEQFLFLPEEGRIVGVCLEEDSQTSSPGLFVFSFFLPLEDIAANLFGQCGG